MEGQALKDIRVERDKKLAKIKQYLDHQRMSAEVMAQVQGDMDEYRRRGKEATEGSRSDVAKKQAALLSEWHHDPDIKLLKKFMTADGRP